MAEHQEDGPADLTAQVRRHLESLRAAGVDWLPASSGAAGAGRRGRTPRRGEVLFEPEIARAPPRPCRPNNGGCDLRVLAEQVSRLHALQGTGRHADANGLRRRAASTPRSASSARRPAATRTRSGEPFVGPAGQLLNRIIAACG